MKLEMPLQIFEKLQNIFLENQSNWKRDFPSGQTEGRKGGRTDMPKPLAAFCNFAKMHRESNVINHIYAVF
jgi:hypothetical protein